MTYLIVTEWNGQRHYSKETDNPRTHRLAPDLGVRKEFYKLTSAEGELSLSSLTSLYRAGTLSGQLADEVRG